VPAVRWGLFFLFCPSPSYGISGVSSGKAEVCIKNRELLHEAAVVLCHRDKANHISGIPVTEISNPSLPYSLGRIWNLRYLFQFRIFF